MLSSSLFSPPPEEIKKNTLSPSSAILSINGSPEGVEQKESKHRALDSRLTNFPILGVPIIDKAFPSDLINLVTSYVDLRYPKDELKVPNFRMNAQYMRVWKDQFLKMGCDNQSIQQIIEIDSQTEQEKKSIQQIIEIDSQTEQEKKGGVIKDYKKLYEVLSRYNQDEIKKLTGFELLVLSGEEEAIKYVGKELPPDNGQGIYGNYVSLVARTGSLESMKCLFEALSIDPKFRCAKTGKTLWHFAIDSGSADLMKYANSCWDSMSIDKHGRTPLHYAAMIGSEKAVKYVRILTQLDYNAKDSFRRDVCWYTTRLLNSSKIRELLHMRIEELKSRIFYDELYELLRKKGFSFNGLSDLELHIAEHFFKTLSCSSVEASREFLDQVNQELDRLSHFRASFIKWQVASIALFSVALVFIIAVNLHTVLATALAWFLLLAIAGVPVGAYFEGKLESISKKKNDFLQLKQIGEALEAEHTQPENSERLLEVETPSFGLQRIGCSR